MFVCGFVFAISPKEQAKICAEENLAEYINAIKPLYNEFGLTSEKDLDKAVLGEPVENVTLEPVQFTPQKSLEDQLKPHAFYVFPVLVDGQSVMDFTVVLENGEWHPVDIGGNLTENINEVCSTNHLSIDNSQVLRVNGQTFVLVENNGKLLAFSPYLNYPENNIKVKQLFSEQELSIIVNTIRLNTLQNQPLKDGETLYGASSTAIPFRQQSVIRRLVNFVNYKF